MIRCDHRDGTKTYEICDGRGTDDSAQEELPIGLRKTDAGSK